MDLSTEACWAHLSEDDKAGLVRGQAEHDEVGVQAVQAVADVGVPPRAAALLPDVRHDLVLALPRDVGIRQDDLRLSPHTRQRKRRW